MNTQVQVHEIPNGGRYRYFVSVGGKVSPATARSLEYGHGISAGLTKSEAMSRADWLRKIIASRQTAIHAAEEQALAWDTSTNRFTVQRQREALVELIAPYSCDIPESKAEAVA